MRRSLVCFYAVVAIALSASVVQAKRNRVPAADTTPAVEAAPGTAANAAAGSATSVAQSTEGVTSTSVAAYAPAPAQGLTAVLDTIFKPQEAAVLVSAPAPALSSVATAEVADEVSMNFKGAPSAGPMRSLVAKHAAANGVPFALAHAVIMVESKYAARVAHAGNYGLMQIRAQTARGMGFSGSAAGLLDPDTNLRFGMKYLGLALKMARGDTCGALMRYQSGVATTRMSSSNRAYCARARGYMAGN